MKIMKLNRLETHDRLQHLTKQNFDIGECCQNLIDQRPFGDHPFYIFAHTRTEEDAATKRLIWQPRLTKPRMQTNSMLFKAYPGTDHIKVIWMLPAEELWSQFEANKVTENKTVMDSIRAFQTNREQMEAREEDDLTDEEIDAVYRNIAQNLKAKKTGLSALNDFKQQISEGSSTSLE